MDSNNEYTHQEFWVKKNNWEEVLFLLNEALQKRMPDLNLSMHTDSKHIFDEKYISKLN